MEQYLKSNHVRYDKQDITAFFDAGDRDEDHKISLSEFNQLMRPFHPSQILKDRERAFYSTPKKYRRLDHSPMPSQPKLAVNNSFTNVRSK